MPRGNCLIQHFSISISCGKIRIVSVGYCQIKRRERPQGLVFVLVLSLESTPKAENMVPSHL